MLQAPNYQHNKRLLTTPFQVSNYDSSDKWTSKRLPSLPSHPHTNPPPQS